MTTTTYQISLSARLARKVSYSHDTVAEHEIKLEVPDYCLSQVVEAQLAAMMQLLLPAIAQSAIVERAKIKLLGDEGEADTALPQITPAAAQALRAQLTGISPVVHQP